MSHRVGALSPRLFVLPSVLPHPGGLVWRERAPMPRPRAGYMGGVINGRLIIAGGSYWEDGRKIWTTRVDSFDPSANTWQAGAPLSEPSSDAASVSYQDALYIFGGGVRTEVRQDALVFRDGKWSPLPEAALPEPRLYAVAVVCGGLIYLVGGMPKAGDYRTVSNSLWVWNPASPSSGWKKLPCLPGPGLITHAVAEVDGRIYVFGGATAGGPSVVNVSNAYMFDPHTEDWARLPDMPIARRAWWAVSLCDLVLLLSGYTTTYEKEVYTYELASGTFRLNGELPHGLADTKFFRINSWVVGAGGEAGDKIRGSWTLQADLPPAWMKCRPD